MLRINFFTFLFHFVSFTMGDGEAFGQGRDQAELLDNTVILLSLDQLRQVHCTPFILPFVFEYEIFFIKLFFKITLKMI